MQMKTGLFSGQDKNCKGFSYNYALGRLNFEAFEAYPVLKHAWKMQQLNKRCFVCVSSWLIRSLFTFEQSETKFTLLL